MKVSDYANQLPPSSRLTALRELLIEKDLPAPIDLFRQTIRNVTDFGTQDILDKHEFLGGILVLRLIAATETYVRSVLSSCMQMCPLCQAHAATQRLNFGGVIWHGKDGFGKSAFDDISFSSAENLTGNMKKFINFKMEDAQYKEILKEYDNICHLRHAIVHNDGFLPGKNAVQLDIPRYNGPVYIFVKYKHLQEIAAIVNSLVLTLNRDLFDFMCKRWAIDWRSRADWDDSDAERRFSAIWRVFHSKNDLKFRKGRSNITRLKCMNRVKIEYDL